MPGPNRSLNRPPQDRWEDLQVDELTQEIDMPLEDLLRQDEPMPATLDFEDIENALDT